MRKREVHSMVFSPDEFRELLNEIYETTVYVDFGVDGIYIDEDDEPADIESLHERLAGKLSVDEVTSIHIDDYEPCGVWVSFKDRDIIRESDYIAVKKWSEEDVIKVCRELGLFGTEEQVSDIINSGQLDVLADCTDQDWNVLYDAVFDYKRRKRGAYNRVRDTLRLKLTRAGEKLTVRCYDHSFSILLKANVYPDEKICAKGEVAVIEVDGKTIRLVTDGVMIDDRIFFEAYSGTEYRHCYSLHSDNIYDALIETMEKADLLTVSVKVARDIQWETDDERDDLPEEAAVPGYIDDVADYLSDTYGFLVSSYTLEERK